MNGSSSVSNNSRTCTDLSYEELLVEDWQSCNERLSQNLSAVEENQALHYRKCIEQEMCGLGLMVDGRL